MRIFIKTLLALSFFWTVPAVAMEADAVVKKANHMSYYQGNDGRAKVNMRIIDAQGRTRMREFVILRKDDGDQDLGQKFYVYFNKPADVKKMVFMVVKNMDRDDDRWLYLPSLDLVKRIAASDERTSFVGSHFYYEDVSGRGIDEDSHELLEENDKYYVLKSTPKNPKAVEFHHYKSWIHKATFLPVKTEYYDAQGVKIRSYTALKVDMISGFPTVTASSMEDHRSGGKTLMNYSAVKYDVGYPDNIFTERYLRKAPRKYLR
ncbi:Putative outer membrane protein [hydrothermal vent metagenome]|uniref:Outer membrane protein n=1 Tax=hydrothermal vent metagenome TaxID=652676 RepID=A0A3B0S603_9ZZZZ